MSGTNNEPDTEPLLLQYESTDDDAQPHDDPDVASEASASTRTAESATKIRWISIISLTVITLFYIFSNYLLVIPTLRLYENAVCRDFYHERDGDIDEELCKIPEIQSRLATLVGWNIGFQAIPGLLTAVLYGSLADQYGRKPILLAAMAGEFASWAWILLVCYLRNIFPIRAIWVSSTFLFLGGGPRVTVSLLYASIVDSVPENCRTQFLYLRAAMSHLASLSAPLLASWLMQRSLPLLFELVFILWILTFVTMSAFKETLRTRRKADLATLFTRSPVKPDATSGLSLAEPDGSIENRRSTPYGLSRQHQRHASTSVKIFVLRVRNYVRDACSGLMTTNLLVCFSIFLLKRLAFTSESFIYQYSSKVLHWKLAKTVWIQSTQSISALITMALLLPFINGYFQKRRRVSTYTIDVTIARACLLIAVLGCLLVWRARHVSTIISGVFIIGLAEGLEPTVQGLCVSFADASATGRLFTFIAAIDMVAMLFSGPIMGAIFAASQNAGPLWIGLVYFVAAIIFFLLFVSTLFLRQTSNA